MRVLTIDAGARIVRLAATIAVALSPGMLSESSFALDDSPSDPATASEEPAAAEAVMKPDRDADDGPTTVDSSSTSPDLTEAPSGSDATQLAGPGSVTSQLRTDREDLSARLFAPYETFKSTLRDEHGLSFGIDYNALFQTATASLGEDLAAAGAFRIFGDWELVGRGTEDVGGLVFKVENRHRLGTDVAPAAFGSELGYAGETGNAFSDAGWLLTNLYWRQRLLEGRVEFFVGVVDTTDYVDMYGFVNPWTDFTNLAFLNGPTTPTPSQGLGAVAALLLTDHLYVHAGVADGNGDPGEPLEGFGTFFSTREWFSHVEVGWILSTERAFSDNVHLTAWYADARRDAGSGSGWGLAFSYNQLFDETWQPFLRAGYADGGGAQWQWSVSAGVGYHLRENDLLALGINWGRPSPERFGTDLDDQITAELFYRLQLGAHVTITPDVQLLVDPALNPDESVIAVFGVRARVDF